MATKPLMTSEQQTMFKQAVAQGALQPYPYKEYCAITPEKAKEILKTLEGKVDFNLPPSEKGGRAPSQEAPAQTQETPENPERTKNDNAPASKAQRDAISGAVAAGDWDALDEESWKKLTRKEASDIIRQIHEKRPPELATEGQKKEIVTLVKSGRIYSMSSEKFHSLSKDDASKLISIGRYNEKEGRVVDGYDPNYTVNRNQPKTREQDTELKRLVADKRLNPVSREKWINMTREEAGKLIFIGQQREKEETFAPPPQSREQENPVPEHSQEQASSAPEQAKEEEKKTPKKTPGKSTAKKGNAPEKARDYDDDIPF